MISSVPFKRQARGFTLVELAIVLVIVGVIAMSVVTGKTVIEAAQLRSVASQATEFRSAVNAFRLQYDALPGDFSGAFRYWGTAAGCTNTTDLAAGCNGTGDGNIFWLNANTPALNHEGILIWMHLARAGLISGVYSGFPIDTGPSPSPANGLVAGTNAPASSYKGGIWATSHTDCTTNQPTYATALARGNFFSLGANRPNFMAVSSLFSPTTAESLDVKSDDGLPNSGKIFGAGGFNGTVYSTFCLTSTTPVRYDVSIPSAQCYLGFFF